MELQAKGHVTFSGNSDRPVDKLIDQLRHSVATIAALDDLSYRKMANATSSVGAQFRHCLDFVSALVKGIETGRIDYNDRERDPRIETDRHLAMALFEQGIRRLSAINGANTVETILVRSELDSSSWLPSSLAREIEFVHSHTVHHHALIGEKLAGLGIEVTENFGVAPSTLENWRGMAA